MNVQTRTKLYETIRAVLKNRSDHDIADHDQREVVVDELAESIESVFQIKLQPL